ncbi:MAG: dihydrofolate reductase [Devosia sp.]
MSVPIAMVAAVAENGVIGAGNAIPWRLPSDFAHFKQITLGKPVVMGRLTFESIGKPLTGRTNIVVSRKSGYEPEGVIVVADLEAALARAQTIAATDGAQEVIIGGGAQIYTEAMPFADRLYISHVALRPDGDTHFPAIDPAEWDDVRGIEVPPNPKDSAAFRVRVYQRRGPARR